MSCMSGVSGKERSIDDEQLNERSERKSEEEIEFLRSKNEERAKRE